MKFFMYTPQHNSLAKLYAFAITECLLVFPATLFLAAATLRVSQPRQYEPARTSWIIFEWMTTHLTRMHAVIMFLVLPVVAFSLGVGILIRHWRRNELLRSDVIASAGVVRRNLHFLIVTVGALAGLGIFVAAVVHIITD
jgi:hypothetical protein